MNAGHNKNNKNFEAVLVASSDVVATENIVRNKLCKHLPEE